MTLSIVTGVISGLLATFLVLIWISFWGKIIVPWYEDKIYKDIRIDGRWKIEEEENGEICYSTTEIKQIAHEVYGEIKYENELELPLYQFKGEFRNLILTATHWPKANNKLDRGTFTLMLTKDGQILQGFYSWYPNEGTNVIHGPYKWIRI